MGDGAGQALEQEGARESAAALSSAATHGLADDGIRSSTACALPHPCHDGGGFEGNQGHWEGL
jgi:hypothetical protein